jgi:transposase
MKLQTGWDPSTLVFLDESGAKTNMTRLRGRSMKGNRLNAAAPHGHWCTTTMISSIRLDGRTTCMALEGATDTEAFLAYVEKVLIPTLRAGDVVVMDNLGAHKSPKILGCFEAVGIEVLFLPPYSPDLNPIEKMWSKVKQSLRGAEARTKNDLIEAMANALSCVSKQDAVNWFASCGYSFI